MRFMVIVPADQHSEAGELPSEQILRDMIKFNDEMVQAGVMLMGEGLHPTKQGVRLKFSGKSPTVIDGPFTESKELIAGFWLIKTKSLEEAISWIKRAPFGGGVEVEIRQVFEAEDLGAGFTPELRAQSERQRAQAAKNAQQK
jgi:hypothetical protein